jgi:hypothetical protein
MGRKIKFVALEISTWRGYGGVHYYGKLKNYELRSESVNIEREIKTEEEAALLNKKDSNTPDGHWWKVGHITSRIDTKEEVIETAKKIWRKHFPKADALVLGLSSCGDPQQPLDGDPKIVKKLQSFYDRFVRVGRYEGNKKAAIQISDAYWDWVCGK